MLFTQPNGAVERFVDAWGNTPATGKNRGYRVLDRAPDGTWTVTDEATVWHFTSGGDLVSVESPDGSAEARYRGNLLVQIAGPDGPTIGLKYRTDGRLEGVVDLRDQDRFVRYEYDPAGRLARVLHWDGSVEAYAYDGDSARIASIEDGSGRTLLRLAYDEDGRVIREQDTQGLEDGEAVRYQYEALDNGWLRTTVTYPMSVVEPGWHPIEQSLHDANGFVREMRFYPTSDQELVGRYDYDPENRRIVVEDPCPPAVGIDQVWPWLVASPWVVFLYLVLGLFGLLLPG
jgi:YD repeat-containing protein